MTDPEKVFQVLEAFPNSSMRMIADYLGWGLKRADSARVHRAMLQLAASAIVAQRGKKWRVVARSRET